MRSYIFGENERRVLEDWLENGVEDQATRNLFSKTRRNVPGIRKDLRKPHTKKQPRSPR